MFHEVRLINRISIRGTVPPWSGKTLIFHTDHRWLPQAVIDHISLPFLSDTSETFPEWKNVFSVPLIYLKSLFHTHPLSLSLSLASLDTQLLEDRRHTRISKNPSLTPDLSGKSSDKTLRSTVDYHCTHFATSVSSSLQVVVVDWLQG